MTLRRKFKIPISISISEPSPELAVDLLLAADVAYESRSFESLVQAFRTLTRPRGRILLAEPGRKVAQGIGDSVARQLSCELRQETIVVEFDGASVDVVVYDLSLGVKETRGAS